MPSPPSPPFPPFPPSLPSRSALPAALACAALAVLAPACGRPGPDAAAVVGGTPISHEAFDTRLATVTASADVRIAVANDPGALPRLESGVLGQMIDAALVARGAAELGVEVTDTELQAAVDDLVGEHLGGRPDGWAEFLAARGYPEAEVRGQLREAARRDEVELALPTGEPSEARVRQRFDRDYAGRPLLRHVLVADEAAGHAVLARLASGEPFDAVARDVSLDTGTAGRGGELGPHVEDAFAAPFEEAVENARDGQVVGPVQTAFGYHVIERRPPAALPDVRADVVAQLVEEDRSAAFDRWLAGLRAATEVRVDPRYGSWDPTTGTVGP